MKKIMKLSYIAILSLMVLIASHVPSEAGALKAVASTSLGTTFQFPLSTTTYPPGYMTGTTANIAYEPYGAILGSVAVGPGALALAVGSECDSVAVGLYALGSLSGCSGYGIKTFPSDVGNGMYNVVVGPLAGHSLSTAGCTTNPAQGCAYGLVALGYNAFGNMTGGPSTAGLGANTGAGVHAGQNVTTGYGITIFGGDSFGPTTGHAVTCVGAGTCGTSMTTASNNVGVGSGGTMGSMTTGTDNVSMGISALFGSTTASGNVAIGTQALQANVLGNDNVAVGYQALYSATGSFNMANGYLAGNFGVPLTTGSFNTFDGSGSSGTGGADNYEIVIGSLAVGHGSGTTTIGTVGQTTATYVIGTLSDTVGQVFDTAGTGMGSSGSTVNSRAVDHPSFQPGLMTSVSNAKSAFYKYSNTSTVDNIEVSAQQFSCTGNPTVTMYECGTSKTCSSSPVTIGSATIVAAGTVVDGTISSAAITAGDYIAFAISAGTCITLDVSATAQVHSN